MEVYLDAAYAIALSAVSDQHHESAIRIAERLEAEGTHLVTTRAVILEIGNALSRQRYRQSAVELLSALEEDPGVEIVEITGELYANAFRLYQDRNDKDWGLTDCISFVVMEGRGITEALTTDEHFQQAGYRALLRETT